MEKWGWTLSAPYISSQRQNEPKTKIPKEKMNQRKNEQEILIACRLFYSDKSLNINLNLNLYINQTP
jgi:hypothetical protein